MGVPSVPPSGGSGPLDALPAHVRERVRVGKAGKATPGGCVVYWMRSALRGHDNPALDAAIVSAAALRVPVCVFLHVEDRYPFATLRRQRFLLEGARSAQAEMQARGLAVVVQVDRRQHRRPLLMELANAASLVVAEEPFCVPWLAGVETLCKSQFDAPVWLADCASIVPSALVPPKDCQRAYTFEAASKRLHAERLCSAWQDALVVTKDVWPELPTSVFDERLDLSETDLDELICHTEVDFSVPPVTHTCGGSAPGYQRWSAWLAAGGLKTYAKRRNDSLDPRGVSRMSAYLNLGMVSPMRIAHDASRASGSGKSKFLHELLTWRGVAYAHCYHFPMPATGATLEQLPPWAQSTLRAHARDRRQPLQRGALAAGQSGDSAWDGMQRYLVQTGELHNNARMGWGKALAFWTASPEEALDALIELNNRFALDGHAPPSYAGLLGCLGLFEGPKQERSVVGKVSYKPPKSKYASMPQVAQQLEAATADAKTAAVPAPARPFVADSENAALRSCDGVRSGGRRWQVALKRRHSDTACIDLM